MNLVSWPEAIEKAIASCLREFSCSTLPDTWIHCVSDNVDFTKDDGVKVFPQLLISCGGKYMEEEGTTWAVDIAVDCATWYLDDPTCSIRTGMYRDVESILDCLIYPCAKPCDIVTHFQDVMRDFFPTFSVGGFTPSNSGTPSIIEGAQVITYSGTLHFSF